MRLSILGGVTVKDYVTGLGGIALAGYLYTVTRGFAAEGGGLAKNPAYYPNLLLVILSALSVLLSHWLRGLCWRPAP